MGGLFQESIPEFIQLFHKVYISGITIRCYMVNIAVYMADDELRDVVIFQE